MIVDLDDVLRIFPVELNKIVPDPKLILKELPKFGK
jgi:hypothetical protein